MKEINYSAELLHRDKTMRMGIVELLQQIKEDYGVSGRNIVELGCGLGHNLEIFSSDNSVYGIEGVPDAVNIAHAAGLNVKLGDLEKTLMLGDASVDWVLCLDVLEHLVNPIFLMEEIQRILVKDGRAILNVPNHFIWSGRIKLLFGSGMDVCNFFPDHREWDNPHIRFFTRNGFQEMIRLSGFSIVEDLSYKFPAFPLYSKLKKFGLSRIGTLAATAFPAIFAGGHFFIVKKV